MSNRRRSGLFVACLAAALPWTSLAGAETPAATLAPAQQEELKALFRNFILENPEVILESVQRYEAKQEAKAREEARAALVSNRDVIENNKTTPFAGNPKGDVTIVEFFDYNCGYCKRMIPVIQEVLATDKNVRYVFKEFPILRQESVNAAKAALGVWKIAPDKYFAYHTALMETRGELSEDRLMKAAEGLGINAEKLKKAMADPEVEQELRRNAELAQKLGVNGTPAFIIGDNLLPGQFDLATMRELIARKRGT